MYSSVALCAYVYTLWLHIVGYIDLQQEVAMWDPHMSGAGDALSPSRDSMFGSPVEKGGMRKIERLWGEIKEKLKEDGREDQLEVCPQPHIHYFRGFRPSPHTPSTFLSSTHICSWQCVLRMLLLR